ncbi:MAG TPA: glycosyltransferase family 4 protein [Gemmatimonadales bacterium]|nr:glycosyltransferase family 4 protein [Gemmatimonadales bacterium]
MTSAPASSGGLRIALLTGAIGWRGSSAIYATLATGLAARGHETLVLVDDAGLAARMEAEGARVAHVPARNTGLAEMRRVRDALAPLRPQVLMADRPRDLRVAAVATLGWPTRLLYRYNLAHRHYPGDAMSRFALWRAAAVVFPSRAIARLARERTPRLRGFATALVPNGVDTARFHPDPDAGHAFRRAQGIPDDAWVVLLPAALVRGKGHEAAIAAISRIGSSAERPIVFVAAGDGKLAADIRAKAETAGLSTRFPGTLSPDDLRAAFSAADVVVHPSDMETFGMSVAEAMACGRPVIATAVGGVPEITGRSGRAGLLVPLGDADALADALLGLLDDPARRAAMGEAARRRIESRFPLAAMVEGYERLFLRLADRA